MGLEEIFQGKGKGKEYKYTVLNYIFLNNLIKNDNNVIHDLETSCSAFFVEM